MNVRRFAVALILLTLASTLRAADNPASVPAFQQPAAFQALLKLGAATEAIYAVFPNETYLTFANDWKGTDSDLSHLNELTTTSTVTITSDKNAALVLPHLAEMPILQRVSVDDVTLSAAQVKLLGVLKLKSLYIGTKAATVTLDGLAQTQSLSLGGAVEHVTLTNVPALEFLNIQRPSEAHAKLDLNVPSAPKLKVLMLKNLVLTDIPLSPTLESVDFSSCTVPDALLMKISQLKDLHYLILNDVPNASVALSHLGDSQLKMLQAASAHVTNDAVAAIKDLSHIQSLNLGGNPDFTGKGMAPLTTEEMLQIEFDQTAVNDATIAALVASAKSSALFINLDDSDISDKAVTSLVTFPNLISISLAKTHITDVALMSLANAKRLGSVRLTGAPVSDSGIADLRKALPKATISPNIHSVATPEK